jgi:hypothetical protein
MHVVEAAGALAWQDKTRPADNQLTPWCALCLSMARIHCHISYKMQHRMCPAPVPMLDDFFGCVAAVVPALLTLRFWTTGCMHACAHGPRMWLVLQNTRQLPQLVAGHQPIVQMCLFFWP